MDTNFDASKLSTEELIKLYNTLSEGEENELPFDLAEERERGLDSPSYFATQIIDPFYRDNFEDLHYPLMDEVLAPWILGNPTLIEGVEFQPKNHTGLLVLWPRSTLKSSMCRLIALWAFCYYKIRLNKDLTLAYIHQVISKSKDHGEGIKQTARTNQRFRKRYPEFAVRPDRKDWDTKDNWRWPHGEETLRQAANWSWTSYGESSSMTGGHYDLRIVDDWETEDSVTTAEMCNQSESKFRTIENLKIRGQDHNPWLAVGTYYHHDGPYKRLERGGGWITYRVPAFRGSSKAIFDLVNLDDRDKKDQKKIESGIRKLEKTRAGDLNFPRLLSWRELYLTAKGSRSESSDELTGGYFIFACQILLDPVPEGEERFDRTALDNSWFENLPHPSEAWLYIRVDPAISKKRKNDETAIIAGLVKWNRHRYIVQSWIGRDRRPTSVIRRIYTIAARWKEMGYVVKNIGIETVSFQEALAAICREGVPEREPQYDGESVPMMMPPCPTRSIGRSPEVRKRERIMEMDGPVTRHEVHFWVNDPGMRKLHTQFVNFPHDRFDGLDATHDLWKAVQTPPRKIEDPKAPAIPIELQKLLKGEKTKVGPKGYNSVRTQNW